MNISFQENVFQNRIFNIMAILDNKMIKTWKNQVADWNYVYEILMLNGTYNQCF